MGIESRIKGIASTIKREVDLFRYKIAEVILPKEKSALSENITNVGNTPTIAPIRLPSQRALDVAEAKPDPGPIVPTVDSTNAGVSPWIRERENTFVSISNRYALEQSKAAAGQGISAVKDTTNSEVNIKLQEAKNRIQNNMGTNSDYALVKRTEENKLSLSKNSY